MTAVPHPIWCRHGMIVGWRYVDDTERIDTRLRDWCRECKRERWLENHPYEPLEIEE